MYDNPVSWGVLLVLAIACGIWFAWKCMKELEKPEFDNRKDPWDDPRNKYF